MKEIHFMLMEKTDRQLLCFCINNGNTSFGTVLLYTRKICRVQYVNDNLYEIQLIKYWQMDEGMMLGGQMADGMISINR